jgi:hypothetical protein
MDHFTVRYSFKRLNALLEEAEKRYDWNVASDIWNVCTNLSMNSNFQEDFSEDLT